VADPSEGLATSPFLQKVTGTENRYDSFLAAFIYYRELDAAFLNVHNAIGRIALGENGLLFLELRDPS
jgi:hypothetical protein